MMIGDSEDGRWKMVANGGRLLGIEILAGEWPKGGQKTP